MRETRSCETMYYWACLVRMSSFPPWTSGHEHRLNTILTHPSQQASQQSQLLHNPSSDWSSLDYMPISYLQWELSRQTFLASKVGGRLCLHLQNENSGVRLWCSRLRIKCCHCSGLGWCCGLGLIPGSGNSIYPGCSQTNKTNQKSK